MQPYIRGRGKLDFEDWPQKSVFKNLYFNISLWVNIGQ